uniref:Uncharacterized protein n=1 Tax=Bracon brevicornis TaxID=1563983 RepID=A0A6V7M5X2_9HYME
MNEMVDTIDQFVTHHGFSSKFKSQMTLFSMELMHQNVDFSACGVFSFNDRLLYSVRGTLN